MSKSFRCCHCQNKFAKNPRLKTRQRYCNSKSCQQARKNQWEREKLNIDATYKAKRQAAKRKWYSNYPGDQYQSAYRKTHDNYRVANREKQRKRNQRRSLIPLGQKIVKTDALKPQKADTQGLYLLSPYGKKDVGKIVKTDAFIVQIIAPIAFGAGQEGDFLPQNSS